VAADTSLDDADPGDVIYADGPITTRVDDGVESTDGDASDGDAAMSETGATDVSTDVGDVASDG
jgi:hypothetical protein